MPIPLLILLLLLMVLLKDPYVRKTAAVCVAKLYDINAELVEDQGFLQILRDLICDPNPTVRVSALRRDTLGMLCHSYCVVGVTRTYVRAWFHVATSPSNVVLHVPDCRALDFCD